MSTARWAQAALYAAALTACASAHGSQRAETSSSYRGGQAAQPQSWVSRAPSSPAAQSPVALTHEPAGQAAQQYSWIGEPDPIAPSSTPLAQEGSLYLGGRAAQPNSWLTDAPRRNPNAKASLATAPSSGRQH
ncbi:MAG: hypothetical protein JWN48_5013 [Myxococcaceae bacterium]|nr:hypothetical protein [Myxococcaceae bacterium]